MTEQKLVSFSAPGRRVLVAILATTMLAGIQVAVAQQQPQTQPPAAQKPSTQPAPRPQAQPAKPPAPQQQKRPAAKPAETPPPRQQPQQQAMTTPPPLVYSPWTKFCLKEDDAKQVCFTGRDARIESGMPIVSAVLIEPEGDQKKMVRITVPLAMKIEPGTRLLIDQAPPRTAPYVACFITGCVADYEVNGDTVNQLKKSQQLSIQAIGINGQPLTVPVPLAEFAKAYDGPPTDPKVIEEQQKKMEEDFQRKREEDARKKLEGAAQPGKTQ